MELPFVSVSGSPYERGKQYGSAVKERVRLSAKLYGAGFAKLGYDKGKTAKLIADFSREIAEYGEHYLAEMQGIADGAGLPIDDIIIINARTEIIFKAKQEMGHGLDHSTLDDGCSGAVIMPERSANGNLIQAQNWDWRMECLDTGIILRVQQDDGPDFITFVEAGGLARCGMNSAGISLTGNFIACDRDHKQSGVPIVLIRRNVLEQTHYALAMKALHSTPKACSSNMIVSTAEGFGIDFECAPDEAFPIYPEDGLIVHANHWVSPVALSKLKDTGLPMVPESFYRDWRIRKLLNDAGRKLTMKDMKRAFADTFGSPYSVCRPLVEGNDIATTVVTVVMEPGAGIMDVAVRPAEDPTFTRYSFTADPVPA